MYFTVGVMCHAGFSTSLRDVTKIDNQGADKVSARQLGNCDEHACETKQNTPSDENEINEAQT